MSTCSLGAGMALAAWAALAVSPWYWLLAILLGILWLFTIAFFRDPHRQIPADTGLLVSPADGRVSEVTPLETYEGIDGPAVRIGIFLSVFDVHINRAPIAGTVEKVEYHAGEFLPAFDDKASLRNEQNAVIVKDGEGRVMFKQIAGLIARRIVFRKKVDEPVTRGERVGLIKFGSRVDVFLPKGWDIRVKVGDRVEGGASVLAKRP